MFYRRRLPHWIPPDAVLFLTWRLAGSLPVPPPDILTLEHLAGTATRKAQSSSAASGPFWLQEPRVAGLVANALHYGETIRGFYDLYAWVINA